MKKFLLLALLSSVAHAKAPTNCSGGDCNFDLETKYTYKIIYTLPTEGTRCSVNTDTKLQLCFSQNGMQIVLFIVEKVITAAAEAVSDYLDQADRDNQGIPRKEVQNKYSGSKCSILYDRDENRTYVTKKRANGTEQWSADHEGEPCAMDNKIIASCSVDD